MLSLVDCLYLFKHRILGEKNIYITYKQLMENRLLSRGDMEKFSFLKFKKIVEYAYENSPFYKEYYNKKKFNPSMLKEVGDWNKVPIIEKEDIRNNFSRIIPRKTSLKYCKLSTTGGSTGEPLKVLQDTRAPYSAISWRVKSLYGLSFSSDIACVGRNVSHSSRWRRLLSKLFWYPHKIIALDASSVSQSDLDNFVKRIIKYRPKIITGYVGTILLVGRYVLQRKIEIPKVDLCWVTSAPVSEVEKKILREVFKGDIVDQYGSCEIPWLAFETPEHIGLYVPDDCRHIDIVNDDNQELEDNVYGNIVATNLDNYSFPIIRYKNGDRTKKLDIQGKLPFTLLASIKGRVSDKIITPSGIAVSGEFLTTIFDDYADVIVGFQIIQHKDYSLTLKYMKNDSCTENKLVDVISTVRDSLAEKTGFEIDIKTEIVKKIPDDRGKTRYIINEITNNIRK